MPSKPPAPPQGLCFVEVEHTMGDKSFVNASLVAQALDRDGLCALYFRDDIPATLIRGTAREFVFRAADSVALLENNPYRVDEPPKELDLSFEPSPWYRPPLAALQAARAGDVDGAVQAFHAGPVSADPNGHLEADAPPPSTPFAASTAPTVAE